MDSRLGDRGNYTITDLPICVECGINTMSNGWVDRVGGDFDICGKKHGEGEQADRKDVINIDIYRCGTCNGDWADEDYDEETGEWDTESKWDVVDKEVQENWIPEVATKQPLAKEWRKMFDLMSGCGYGHASLDDIYGLWQKAQETNNGIDLL